MADNPSQAAAFIFRHQIVSQIGEENSKLRSENLTLGPLRESLREVTICLGDNITQDECQIISACLDNGSVVNFDNDQELVIPIDAYPQLLGSFLAKGSIVLTMSDQYVGSFPNETPLPLPHLEVSKDNTDRIAVYVSAFVCAAAKLDGLSIEEVGELKEGIFGPQDIFMSPFLSPSVTYTPDAIIMKMTTQL